MTSVSPFDEIIEALSWILVRSPVLLVYLLGIIIALVRYRRHPKVSTLALVAMVGLFLQAVIMPLVYRFPLFLPGLFSGPGSWIDETVLKIMSFGNSCLEAVFLFILFLAVFAGRSKQLGIRGADGQYLPPDVLTQGK
jgi:hypothetical protein